MWEKRERRRDRDNKREEKKRRRTLDDGLPEVILQFLAEVHHPLGTPPPNIVRFLRVSARARGHKRGMANERTESVRASERSAPAGGGGEGKETARGAHLDERHEPRPNLFDSIPPSPSSVQHPRRFSRRCSTRRRRVPSSPVGTSLQVPDPEPDPPRSGGHRDFVGNPPSSRWRGNCGRRRRLKRD